MAGRSGRWSRNRILIAVLGALGILALVGTTLGGAIMPFLMGDSGGAAAPRTAAAPTSTAPPVIGRPLSVRPVFKALVSKPEECLPVPPPPPLEQPAQACDLDNAARYDLGPVALQLNLTGASSAKLPMTEFYTVQIAMDAGSSAAFTSYTAANIGKQLAFVRDGVVLAAPAIDQPISGQSIQLSGNMSKATADTIARMLRDGS
jgi:hypothetical protein